jgi:hypothetical protein
MLARRRCAPPASLTEVINNLDQNLISGLGSGIDISYAKKQQQSEKK